MLFAMCLPTKVFQASPLLSDEDLEVVAALLAGGKVAAIPTETVYGLAADMFQEEALREIFRVKGRPSDNPLIAHVGTLAQMEGLVKAPSKLFFRLAERFWPGPLTLIAPRSARVSDLVAAGLPTVAVRMPSHPCALQILRRTGPLAAPSANLSGRPSPTTATHVLDDFAGAIPLVVDGGAAGFGIESTVIGTVGETAVLLRPGAIAREKIESFLGMRLEDSKKGGAPLSPGMKYRHYAPKAKVFLVKSENELERLRGEGAYVPLSIGMQNLYAELREADRLQKQAIAIYVDAKMLSNEALMNRLEKAIS